MIKILIVDDRDIIRDSYKLYFSKSKDINLKGEAADGKEAIDLIRKNDFDVVLMDINMPNMNGIEATKKIIDLKSNIKILVNSFYYNPILIKEMIIVGATGFIKKGEKKEVYIKAIETVASGATFLSDEINYKVYDKALAYLKYPSKKLTLNI